MQTNTDLQPDSSGTSFSVLFKLEKIIGLVILAAIMAYHVFRAFGFTPDLPGIYGLFPLLFLWGGAALIFAGAGSEKYPAFPSLCHVPLAIWLIILVLALQ